MPLTPRGVLEAMPPCPKYCIYAHTLIPPCYGVGARLRLRPLVGSGPFCGSFCAAHPICYIRSFFFISVPRLETDNSDPRARIRLVTPLPITVCAFILFASGLQPFSSLVDSHRIAPGTSYIGILLLPNIFNVKLGCID